MRFAQLSRNHACARCLHPCPRCDACAAVKARRHTLLRTSPPLRTKPHDQNSSHPRRQKSEFHGHAPQKPCRLLRSHYPSTHISARPSRATQQSLWLMQPACGDTRPQPEIAAGGLATAEAPASRMRAAVAVGLGHPCGVQRERAARRSVWRRALTAAHASRRAPGVQGRRSPPGTRGCRGCSLQHPLPAGGITKSRGIKRAGVSS